MLPPPHPNIRDPKFQQQLHVHAKVHDDIAKNYDDSISWEEFVMGLGNKRRDLVEMARGKTLEIAAGTARNIDYYRNPPTTHVTMTDVSKNMLEVAYQKLQHTKSHSSRKDIPEFKLAVADASSLPFKDDSFDTVIDCFGLCSMEAPVDSLKEMARVVKPDGRILLLEHGTSGLSPFISDALDKTAEGHARKWGCWYNREIEGLVREAGLTTVHLKKYHFGTTYMIVAAKSAMLGNGKSTTDQQV
ncbi:hypothetical protein SeMB42_g04871 [Synchytrium endobioticum]|uniref:Methyltransferase type 11 domain-containing protein n=1 Tax=Synchytrium endobioticum TaxID=286115 RepID=A0A507CCR2_9FUNG|nr:hypothetical protein SeLEV6574_g07313 [Synchytrium endobioticum]TPX43101.1 hypothetical protein SeMB42_g04871 [Synchytrium endobioticum]